MKNKLLLLIATLLSLPGFAGGFYQQLCQFNYNWKNYAHRAPAGTAHDFTTEREYVQAHLGAVLGILHSNSTSHLSKAQLESRAQMLKWLSEYREAGQFPFNYYRLERIPVFIDEHQTHCAVGYLMMKSGHDDMARRIAAADNYAWVKDIHDAGLPAWQQASGFTVDELKLIQGAYDSYLPNAFVLPNKYEIPQKPQVILAHFEDERTGKKLKAAPENVWLKGEGSNGVLHGKWIQNFALGIPWIIGWFENGKKTGQWAEYYQGTSQLCRTEIWRNDKLNGLRIRYDRQGKVIEEILFREGKVVTKTNYTPEDTLTWLRRPLNDSMLYTEVYNANGALIAMGKEKVYNPGNLQWFQNIELTALNTMAIQASSPIEYVPSRQSAYKPGRLSRAGYGRVELFGGPQLVEYLKEGTWTYYKEYNYNAAQYNGSLHRSLRGNYRHLAGTLIQGLSMFDDMALTVFQDSIMVQYNNNQVCDFLATSGNSCVHLKVNYYDNPQQNGILSFYGYQPQPNKLVVKDCGQYNLKGERIGEWLYFNEAGNMYKKESYLIAWKED
ncbi:MAG: hypothetical protein MUC87_05955 [Bacteroidia bacterium]|jgi:hypothetical protein|nr:hypothetical protein [Bacteroidia bacterium]